MNKNKSYSKFSLDLESKLKNNLFDQDLAIETLVKTLLESNIIKQKSKLKAFFTFIGSANSGKQYLCELLVQSYKDIEHIKTFHMDQYSGNFAVSSDELSPLKLYTSINTFITENPKSILLFKDIEKADLQIQLALYTLFSELENNPIDFSNVIVVMSTNCLSSLLQRKDIKELIRNNPLQAHTFLMERLSIEQISVGNGLKEEAFDRKLLSLLNEHTIIPFNNLRLPALIKIAGRALHNMSQDFLKQSGISIEYVEFDIFVSLLTISLSPYLNARHIKQKIPKLMFNHIYEALKKSESSKQISYSVSKKAKNFLEQILANENKFISKVNKQHNHITLTWNISVKDEIIECLIKNAAYTKDTFSMISKDEFHISDVSFDDIAGHVKVKKELNEIIILLKEPKRLQHFNLTPPKGMFLYGPTGMGKKLLSRAFAAQANMPYIVVSGSDLFDSKNIHNAYANAYAIAPAIVILEDIDVQGVAGGIISTMNIEPLIAELDSITPNFQSPIFTIATLSSSANIPPQLLEAGRIDINIEVPKLDMEARKFFIKEILKKPHDANIDIDRIVKYISGMGGNELKRIGQESSLYAARKGLKELTEEILLEQINIIKYGTKLENKQIRDIETSMAKTAYHEAGHAVLSYVLLPKIKIEQVTVAPRSEALGFVSYHNEDYIDATSKQDIFNDICVLLAGRIAKMEKFGEGGMETGAISDLEAATMQTYAAIALFGMDEELGYINISGLDNGYTKPLFENKIEERILVWLNKAKEHTENEVKRLWKAIDAVALKLIEKEVIDGEELKQIIESSNLK